MLAEFIGRDIANEPLQNAVAMGKELINLALPIDPIFAGELARLCGDDVWAAVREEMGSRAYAYASSIAAKTAYAAVSGWQP